MPVPDTAIIKTYARIDGAEFDPILPMLISSAASVASHICGVDYVNVAMPESVQHWVAATVSYWIENPEAASNKSPSPFLNSMLDPHRTHL